LQLRLKADFNPSQPRVPAGNSEIYQNVIARYPNVTAVVIVEVRPALRPRRQRVVSEGGRNDFSDRRGTLVDAVARAAANHAVRGPGERRVKGVWSIQSLWAPFFPTELEDTIRFSPSLPQGEAFLIAPELPPPIGYEAFQEHIETAVLLSFRSVDSLERFYRVAATQANPVTPHSELLP
jgi:hypothetical protein